MGGGGVPLVLPSVLLYVFTVIILLRVLVISFCVLFSLLAFSLPFSGFLFCFSFAASSSRSFSLPPSPLSFCYFLAFPSSALFSLLSSAFLFLPLLLLPLFLILLFVPVLVSSFLSSGPSFSAFSSLSPPLAFPSLPPLSSPLFIFRLRFFPSVLFFPSCWLFFLLVCPHCLFGGFLFFLFAFLAFGFRFLSVCVFGLFWSSLCFSCWCFRSRGSPFVPVSLSSLIISRRLLLVPLLLLLSSRLFLIFPLLCFFFLLFFYLVPSCRLCCCASLSGSFFLGFALLRSFLCPQPSSLRLRWGGLAPAQ